MTSDVAVNVLTSIHVLSNRITRAFEARLETRHGVTVAEWRVLLSLADASPLTAKRIHERWAMDKMAVSRAVRRLASDGYVRRRRDPDDARSYVLALTPKGRRLFERILPSANERYHEIVSCLSAREQTALRKTLARLIAHTDQLSSS